MKLFLDSSAFAKRFVEEVGSQFVENLCGQACDLALSVICVPETFSALNRLVREQRLSKDAYLKIKAAFFSDIREVDLITVTPDVIAAAVELLENSPLRAMDALHVASAQLWGADLFVSADKRQITAAEAAGLKTLYIA